MSATTDAFIDSERLKENIDISIKLIRESYPTPNAVEILSSGEDKSSALLNLVRNASPHRNIPYDVIFLEGSHNTHRRYSFMQKLKRLWNFRLLKDTAIHRILSSSYYEGVMPDILSDELFIGDGERMESRHRVFPIAHWSSEEIHKYIGVFNLPHTNQEYGCDTEEDKNNGVIHNRLASLGYY